MKLVPLITYYRNEFDYSVTVGAGPLGSRGVSIFKGGPFEGPRLRGRILPGGGEFGLVGAHGIYQVDVRVVLETDDGAHIYLQVQGVVVFNEAARAAGGPERAMNYGEDFFILQPRFETGDPRYEWLNRVVGVGEGRLVPGAVEVRCYEVQHD